MLHTKYGTWVFVFIYFEGRPLLHIFGYKIYIHSNGGTDSVFLPQERLAQEPKSMLLNVNSCNVFARYLIAVWMLLFFLETSDCKYRKLMCSMVDDIRKRANVKIWNAISIFFFHFSIVYVANDALKYAFKILRYLSLTSNEGRLCHFCYCGHALYKHHLFDYFIHTLFIFCGVCNFCL